MDMLIDVECQNCGTKVETRVKDVIPGKYSTCPGCKERIVFEGSDGRQVQRVVDDIEKALMKGLEAFFRKSAA